MPREPGEKTRRIPVPPGKHLRTKLDESGAVVYVAIPECRCDARRGQPGGVCTNCDGAIEVVRRPA